MSVVSPYEDTDAWDSVAFTLRAQGAATMFVFDGLNVDFDGDVENDWDVKKAVSADGARATDHGYRPTKTKLTMLLWRPEHFETYKDFVAAAKPKPGRDPKPIVGVSHPLIQLYGLDAFNIEKISFLTHKAVDQWEAKIELIEWLPAPKPVKPSTESKVTLPEVTIVGRTMTSFKRNRADANGRFLIDPPPSSSVRPTL